MKVLVAGDGGYLGTVLVPHLLRAGHDVVGLDLGLYRGCDLGEAPLEPPRVGGGVRDVRDVRPELLAGFDAVVCLAALSNDPLGSLNPKATYDINLRGTLVLARAARRAGVRRFVFYSSCSLYGAAGAGAVDETAPMHPVTPYGETKALAEAELGLLADDSFSPTMLRNATAYGASPRLRLDIVVNDLVARAVTTGEIRLASDGSPWRPLVHAADIARTAVAVLAAPRARVHGEAFNVGRDTDNLQVRTVAEMVAAAVPGSRVSVASGAGPDRRSYRVDFSKLHDTFPELRLEQHVAGGIAELARAYVLAGLKEQDLGSERFVRLARLHRLLDLGLVDEDLRATGPDPFPRPATAVQPVEVLS